MKLQIFDFDGTLVYSPLRNTFLKVKGVGQGTAQQLYDKWLADNKKPKRKWSGWFGRKETLLHPIFPRPLKEDMLNREVADLFVESQNDSNVITWMMTGRHSGIGHLVRDILMGYDILDETKARCLYATRTPTLLWKLDTITEAVIEEEISEVEMWEDRVEHVEAFTEFGQDSLSTLDCKLTVHHVKNKD